jgi:hypothetical protein
MFFNYKQFYPNQMFLYKVMPTYAIIPENIFNLYLFFCPKHSSLLHNLLLTLSPWAAIIQILFLITYLKTATIAITRDICCCL